MNSTPDKKDKQLTKPILKLNFGAGKPLPEAALQKIEKLKSQGQLLKANEETNPLKKKAAVQIASKSNNKNDNLKTKKAKKAEQTEEAIEVKEESSIDKSAEPRQKQETKPKKWLLLHPTKYQKMLKEFRAEFPNCFSLERKPLALDIRQALIDIKPDYTPMQIAVFLKIYCRGVLYKEKLVLGAERVSLNGEVHSLVTEEQLAKGMSRISEKSKNSKKSATSNLKNPEV